MAARGGGGGFRARDGDGQVEIAGFDERGNVGEDEAPLEAVASTITSLGASENIAQLFREMYEGMAQGKVVPEAAERMRGTTSLETTLRTLLG
jgi:hypothetical protein